jgi:erythromycin esterase-like protein
MPQRPVVLLALSLLTSITLSAQSRPGAAQALQTVRDAALPLDGSRADHDALLELVGESRFVLLGEATHGTREFYRERARLTERLVTEKGFSVIAIEAEWRDAYDVNEYIHGGGPASAEQALATFDRFPMWMWRNREVQSLVTWLRDHNASAGGATHPVGFYGMDLQSPGDSMNAVLAYLQDQDPAAAARAAGHYACLAAYQARPQEYGRDLLSGRTGSCAPGARAVYEELESRFAADTAPDAPGDDTLLSAVEDARVVMDAENYFRVAAAGGVEGWNARDLHMATTLDRLSARLTGGSGAPAKVIAWAHNSHVGDARATARASAGELNLGQVMRDRHGEDAVLVGFTTYGGTVTAATTWGGNARLQALRPALPDSHGALFHQTGMPSFLLPLRGDAELSAALGEPRLQRFVGVVYARNTERASHYYETALARQYDAVIHIDRTTFVQPLPRTPR